MILCITANACVYFVLKNGCIKLLSEGFLYWTSYSYVISYKRSNINVIL